MQQGWLTSVLTQGFTLSDSGIIFTALDENLEQQSQRAFITLLPGQGTLDIQGPDAEKFLQGQLSCDLAAVSISNSCRGAHCTPKGRAIAGFLLAKSADHHYRCLLPASSLPLLQQSLAKYIVFSKAELVDNSEQWAIFGLAGTASEALLTEQFGTAPTPALQQLVHDGALCTRLEGAVPRYKLCMPRAAAARFWQMACRQLRPAHSAAWELLNIRAGIASIDAATSELFIPQMLNYDKLGAISFNKGCYTGQEVISRAHYRGAVKRRMQRFSAVASQCPGPGSPAFCGDSSSGTVVSAVAIDDNHIEGLVVIPENLSGPVLLGEEYGAASLAIAQLDYTE
jgi:hypothetical protein